jgi:hypothetical protein
MFLKLNEYIKNVKNTEYLINKMTNEILSHFPHIVATEDLDKNRTFRKNFFYVKPFQTKEVENILKKYQKIFDKEGLIFTYEEKRGAYSPDNTFSYSYYIYVKEEKIERIKPPKYIYHTTSPQKRESILENGLMPTIGDWGTDLKYKPAIFASIDKNELFSSYGKDVWQIDTTNLKNLWYLDLNLNKYANKNYNKFIMTYEPIPKEALKLYKKIDI